MNTLFKSKPNVFSVILKHKRNNTMNSTQQCSEETWEPGDEFQSHKTHCFDFGFLPTKWIIFSVLLKLEATQWYEFNPAMLWRHPWDEFHSQKTLSSLCLLFCALDFLIIWTKYISFSLSKSSFGHVVRKESSHF